MPLVDWQTDPRQSIGVGSTGMVQRRPRPGPRGVIRPGKAFNNFGVIAAAFPDVISGIVVQTTEELGNVANALAPTLQHQRPGDPAPGNLKASKRTRYYRKAATGRVITGRVEWRAQDPRGHRYAKPLETGSIRRTRRGLRKVRKGSNWLVPAIQAMRGRFVRRLHDLEQYLPH